MTIDITDDDNERPERPDRPSVTASTLTSLTLRWTEPGNTGPPITDYNVQYREGSSGPLPLCARWPGQDHDDFEPEVEHHLSDSGAGDQ